MKISAVVLTKNEEGQIETCLKSFSFCDEIILIDNRSSDRTIEIAKEYRAVVYSRDLKGDFASQRNFAFSKAGGD